MAAHETISHEESIEPGSDRSFGFVVGGILSAIGIYQYLTGSSLYPWFLAVGAPLVAAGAVFPRILRPLNVAWTRLGLLLGRIVTPVVMFLVYVTAIVPIGLLLRLSGKDLLGLKRGDSASTYWIERTPPGPPPESLKDQF